MRISDWSSDVCSSDLSVAEEFPLLEMLHAAGIAVPAPLWLEAESQVLGGAYSVSQRVAGVGRGTSISETGITPAMIKAMAILRSDERRVGQACVSPCRSRWLTYH